MSAISRSVWVDGRRSSWAARAGAWALALLVLGCNSPTKQDPRIGPPPPPPPQSAEELIQALSKAYQQRDYVAFENLFPAPPDSAPYLYFLSEPLPNGQTNWDLTEELRIHRRMFNPESPLPGETPVPQEIWLQSITITLTPLVDFAERPDLYRSPTNPNGLNPDLWKATECVYQANLFFDTQSSTDFRVDGRENFVVIENLAKASGEDRKFLIYRWEDLGSNGLATPVSGGGVSTMLAGTSSQRSWSALKGLYR